MRIYSGLQTSQETKYNMLNAQQILQEGLLKLESSQGKSAQVGYDLSLKAVSQITDGFGGVGMGQVLKEKTELALYEPIAPSPFVSKKETMPRMGWYLRPGAYDITFNEGCNIPANRTGLIRQRSSLLRNGAVIASSVFDPGFQTENMGTVMIVVVPIFIEQDARVAQMYFHENEPAELYFGQFQGDKQRTQ